MGADGNINIYSYKKVKEKFSDEEIRRCLPSGLAYIQKLNDELYITAYYGDNIWAQYNDYDDVSFIDVEKELFERFWKYLKENCQITTWEVWT